MRDQEFTRIGARLFREGLVGGNFGNMSVRAKDGFLITKTGSYLDDPGSPVFVPLDGPAPPEASSEYRVHREVYQKTRHRAIVHSHPPHAVGASLVYDEIIPVDTKGEMFCPIIPVVMGKPGSDEIGRNVADGLCLSLVVAVRGHGTFAAGKSLDEAFILTSLAEHSCRVLWLVGDLGKTEQSSISGE
ncbi:MAG TPA: aldolase [Methanoregulaceae archaeon]|nr:aldolase [Methanoregulaceae archaeon]